MSGLYRHQPSAQLFSGRTELRLIRGDFGGRWGPSERWQSTDIPNPYPLPGGLRGEGGQSMPCQVLARQGEALGGGGVGARGLEKEGRRDVPGLYRHQPSAQLFSGRTELRLIRGDFGGRWGIHFKASCLR